MKQKDKELLLKDLCARLPYMPKVKITYQQQGIKGIDEGNVSFDFIEKIVNDLRNGVIIDMQIYLRPMSSMTDEEIEIYRIIIKSLLENSVTDNIATLYNFLNSKHLDYNGLIPLGLAIKVTEENNPYIK